MPEGVPDGVAERLSVVPEQTVCAVKSSNVMDGLRTVTFALLISVTVHTPEVAVAVTV